MEDIVLNSKAEVEGLKILFYRMRTTEIETALKEHIANGGEEALFVPQPDELEESFKQHLNQIKAKRNAWLAAQEKEMQENYEKKMQLLEQLQALVDKAAQGTPEVNEFRTLQAAWKEIKNIPQPQVTPLWKQYQLLVEQFYDVLKIISNEYKYLWFYDMEAYSVNWNKVDITYYDNPLKDIWIRNASFECLVETFRINEILNMFNCGISLVQLNELPPPYMRMSNTTMSEKTKYNQLSKLEYLFNLHIPRPSDYGWIICSNLEYMKKTVKILTE